MKIVKLFVISFVFFLINSSISSHIHLRSLVTHQNLIKSICKITNDVTDSKTETQDVLIGSFDGLSWPSIINEIAKCFDDGKAVVVTDSMVEMVHKVLRKATVVVVAFDVIDGSSVTKLINNHPDSTIFHHMAKIICIAPSTSTLSQRLKALEVFFGYGFINVAITHETASGDVYIEIVRSLSKNVTQFKNLISTSVVFPDKLKNLEKFHYKVPIYYQPPVVNVVNSQLFFPMMFYLDAVAKAQNAEFDLIFLQDSSHFASYWHNRQMHLTLNTARDMGYADPKVQTYDKKSYCALVPIPPNASYFSVIFVKPFNGLIWMFFGVSIVSSMAIWRLYRGRGAVDSHWRLAVGIFKMFIGHDAGFSQRNRFVLAMLLNIIYFTVFLLSNLYEGAITSYMIEPAHEHRIKTVQELLNSNYEFSSGRLFGNLLINSSLVKAMSTRLNSSGLLMGADDGKNVIEQHFVFIRACDESKFLLSEKLRNGLYVSDYYYLLPEELSWQFIQLEASYLNPFVERLQYYMDLCFQAGLPHMWKILTSQDRSEFLNVEVKDERDILELKDLVPIFGALLIGLGLSGFVLLIEVFYNDCFKSLSLFGNGRSLWTRLTNIGCKNKKLKVHKITVRPMRCT